MARFTGQLRFEGTEFSPVVGLGGDSGSLVVSMDVNRAVGLYFSGSEDGSHGVANPIGEVLEALEVELL